LLSFYLLTSRGGVFPRVHVAHRWRSLPVLWSQACPNCGFRISHFHGHACHHIKPGSGCPNCGTHFCYNCLRRGTSGAACGCRLYCQNDGILAHLAAAPYPRDARCGCPICPDCRPGAECAQCDGSCVVCRGAVPPGPKSLRAALTRTASTFVL
jgi:hypothetical protein